VIKSSGFKRLDDAAESALRLCNFKPAYKDGKPVEAWQPVDYAWSIEES